MPSITSFLLFITFAFSAPATTDSNVGLEARANRFFQVFDQVRQESLVPGMAMSIIAPDPQTGQRKTLMTAMGEKGPNQTMDVDTVHQIGSVSKAFTSVLIGMLVDQGKLNWTDPIAKYMPVFFNNPELMDANVVDMLSQQMGLYENTSLIFQDISPFEMMKRGEQSQSVKPFRNSFIYNNHMFSVIGNLMNYILKTNDSDPYFAWRTMLYQLFSAIGMDVKNISTDIPGYQSHLNKATGYYLFEPSGYQAVPETASYSQMFQSPSGGISMSQRDFSKWMEHWLDLSNKNVSYLDFVMTPHNNADNQSYGLGGRTLTYRGKRYYAKEGGTIGHTSLFCVFPDDNVAASVFVNVYSWYGANTMFFCNDVADQFIFGDDLKQAGNHTVNEMLPDLKKARSMVVADNEGKLKNTTSTHLSRPLINYTGLFDVAGMKEMDAYKFNVTILSTSPPMLNFEQVYPEPLQDGIKKFCSFEAVPFGNDSFAKVVNGALWPSLGTWTFPFQNQSISEAKMMLT